MRPLVGFGFEVLHIDRQFLEPGHNCGLQEPVARDHVTAPLGHDHGPTNALVFQDARKKLDLFGGVFVRVARVGLECGQGAHFGERTANGNGGAAAVWLAGWFCFFHLTFAQVVVFGIELHHPVAAAQHAAGNARIEPSADLV